MKTSVLTTACKGLHHLPIAPLTLTTSRTSSSASLLHHIPPARGLLGGPQTRQERSFFRTVEFADPSAWTTMSHSATQLFPLILFRSSLNRHLLRKASLRTRTQNCNPSQHFTAHFHALLQQHILGCFVYCAFFPLKCTIHKGRDFCLSCVLYSQGLEQHCPI